MRMDNGPHPRPPPVTGSTAFVATPFPSFDLPIITIFPPRHQEAALGHKPLPASFTLYPYPSERPLRSRRHSERVPETRDAAITSMASPRLFGVVAVAVAALVFVIAMSSAQAKPLAPGPGPGPGLAPGPSSTSDGTSLDQGIACVLMLLALVLTYLIHAPDVPAS